MNSDNDLFSASLEAIESSKRVEKFQRFFTKFQRECDVTLNNAQEWIKAELPIVDKYIDLAPLKEELKSSKISTRRKHLLSALIFEQAVRDATHKHQATTAALMAMHMLNHIWQAKLELYETQPKAMQSSDSALTAGNQPQFKNKSEQEFVLKREQILTSLIKKGEQLKSDSQIQIQNASAIQPSPNRKSAPQKKKFITRKEKDLWAEAADKEKQKRLSTLGKDKKSKRKTKGVFSKVRDKIPLKRNSKNKNESTAKQQQSDAPELTPEDSLLDNPNKSAIMVNSGFAKSIDDSLIQARPRFSDNPNESGITVRKVMKKSNQESHQDDSLIQARPRFSDNPNESGITVRKVLKKREQETHEPGSNTIIMKLASGTGKSNGAKLSIPEQCQHAVNRFYQQFPGYDIVAIRNLAAEKVGVSPQYIENLNILPEHIK